MARFLIGLIRVYQRGSRWGPPVCRFQPTCSEYAVQALGKHGTRRGLWLSILRISRCHPFYPGPAADPVPEPASSLFFPRPVEGLTPVDRP